AETQKVFPGWTKQVNRTEESTPQVLTAILYELLVHPVQVLNWLIPENERTETEPSSLIHLSATLLTRLFSQWTSARVLRSTIWLTVWLLVWLLTLPLLGWPPADRNAAYTAGLLYGTGAVGLPIVIALLVYRYDRAFWQSRVESTGHVFFFIFLGALAGFHMGYLIIFVLRLTIYHLELGEAPRWLQALAALWPIGLAYISARLTPLRFWRAFQSLRPTEGDWALFAPLFLFGPLL